MVYRVVKAVKITDETHEDLQKIQKIIRYRGTKVLPRGFQEIIESIKEPTTYKGIIAIAVKVLKELMEKIDEAYSKAEVKRN